MIQYKLDIKPEAHDDIQEGIEWYNSLQPGLGRRFHSVVKHEFNLLRKCPLFQIRFNDVRCLPLKNFPYMVHFIVNEDEKKIVVLGVICTYQNPKKWQQRTK